MKISRGISSIPLIIAIVLGSIIAYAIYYVFSNVPSRSTPPPPPPHTEPPPQPPRYESLWQSYKSDKFGFEFKYPKQYFVEEKEVKSIIGMHTAVILTEDTEENRMLREGKLVGRAGPVAITVDIYSNSSDRLTPEEWTRKRSDSNFKLSDGVLTKIHVDGRVAVYYSWEGLYKSNTVVTASGPYMFVITGSYIHSDDQIRGYFSQVVTFMRFKANDAHVVDMTACGIPGPACFAPTIPECDNGGWICLMPLAAHVGSGSSTMSR